MGQARGVAARFPESRKGVPVAVPAYIADRAEVVKPELARKELAEFE